MANMAAPTSCGGYVDLIFDAGLLGINFDPETGRVNKVRTHGPAHCAGVQESWQIVRVDGKHFTSDVFHGSASKRRTVTFFVPMVPIYQPVAVPVVVLPDS